jgi:hypothetical protein
MFQKRVNFIQRMWLKKIGCCIPKTTENMQVLRKENYYAKAQHLSTRKTVNLIYKKGKPAVNTYTAA